MDPSSGSYIDRLLDLPALLEKKSYFLLGPRQTGKSSLIRRSLPGIRVYDLLDSTTYLNLSQHPGQIGQELRSSDRFIVIDEIQRLPILLNEVHRFIEEKKIHFLLTGSSARTLRRGGVNLLGGRARTKFLHPLSWRELGQRFDLPRAIRHGLLPSIYFSDDPQADLKAYAGTYLQQEIVAEGATRDAPAFSRFLKVAALCNGTVVNFSSVANDAQVARTTVYEYFEILKDTLLLHELPAWRKSKKRKPLASSKYYFFDVGVAGSLQGREFRAGTPEFGEAFETYLMHELLCRRDYGPSREEPLSHWRSASGQEVDFILGDHTAIEAKAKRTIGPQDLKSLRALQEEKKLKNYVVISLDEIPRRVDGIQILPWKEFLERLWRGDFAD